MHIVQFSLQVFQVLHGYFTCSATFPRIFSCLRLKMIVTSTSKLFFVEETMISGVFFDSINIIVVPRFVGVIVEVISQLATLSKFNGRILNHNKCLDNGGLSWWTKQTSIFGGSGLGKSGCPTKKDATGPQWPSRSLVWEWFWLTFVNCTWRFVFFFKCMRATFGETTGSERTS